MKKIHLSTYLTERWLNCVVVTLKNKHTLLQIYVRFLFLPFEFVFLMHTILLKLLLINAKRDLLLEPFFLFFCHTTHMQFEAKLFTFFLCYLFKQLLYKCGICRRENNAGDIFIPVINYHIYFSATFVTCIRFCCP